MQLELCLVVRVGLCLNVPDYFGDAVTYGEVKVLRIKHVFQGFLKRFVSPCDSDHSARHHPHQVLFHSKKGSVRTTIAKRNPKPLGAAERNVKSKLSRRPQHTKRQQVCGAASQSLIQREEAVLSSSGLPHKDPSQVLLPLPCVPGPPEQ